MSVRRRTWKTRRGEIRDAWLVDYVDQAGARHIATFERKRDADAYDAEVRTQVRAGIHTARSQSPTVAMAIADWLERAQTEGLEPASIKQYRELGRHIDQHLGAFRLADLTVPGVHAFRDQLCRTMSRTMAQKILTALKGVLKDAQRRGKAVQNVARDVSVRPDKREVGIAVGVDIPTRDELARILDAASPTARPLLIVAALIGLRASELRALTWSAVDLQRGELHVRQRADRYGVIGRPKSKAGQRVVPFGPLVTNTLKAWRLASTSTGLVFPSRNGTPIDHSNLMRQTLAPAQIEAGVVTARGKPKYWFHALRHFYASWCINRRADGGLELPLKVVSARLGHASIQITADRYGHLFPRADDGAELAAAERALGLRLT